jgi:microcystin-dependent protein
MYGGNGTSNFGLPDLRGRAAGHVGPDLYVSQGLLMGTESVTINTQEYPAHSHVYHVNGTAGTTSTPATNDYLATMITAGSSPPTGPSFYVAAQGAALQPLYNGQPVSGTTYPPVIGYANGGSQPHENRQPYLAMTYCVALQGVFPPRG